MQWRKNHRYLPVGSLAAGRKRAGPSGGYHVLRALRLCVSQSWNVRASGDTISDAWSIKANVSGQLASEPLLSSQTFYLGGAAFGPGYYDADNGISGLIELRFDQSIAGTLIKHYQLYAYTDGGEVWNAGEPKQQLASIGAGVRLDFVDEFHAGAAIAFPVNYSSRTDEFRDARFLFSLSKSFKLCPERPRLQCL